MVGKYGALNTRLIPVNYEKLSDEQRLDNFER